MAYSTDEATRALRMGAELGHLLSVLRAEAGRLELDARRADERGFRQLAAELRGIRLRFLQVIAAGSTPRHE